MKKGIVYAVAALMSVTMAYTAAGCSKSSGNQPEKVYTAEPADKTEGEGIVFSSAWTGKEEPAAETATEPFDTDTPKETKEEYLPENTSPHGGTAAGKTHSQADSWQTPASTRPAVQKQTDEASTQPATQKQYTPAVTQPTTGKQTTAAPAQKQTTTAEKQPEIQKQTTAAATQPAEQQTTVPAKSIYEYPYDVEAIRKELIALGESLGYVHITTKPDGTPITPDNSSWALPEYAGPETTSKILERNLKEWVEWYPQMMCKGDPSTVFTIYIESNGNGEYNFYVLVG